MLLDHDGYLPSLACITDGKKDGRAVAHGVSLAKGSLVVMDRGYTDFGLFGRWTESGIFFVTRQKENADYIVAERRPVDRNILAEEQPVRISVKIAIQSTERFIMISSYKYIPLRQPSPCALKDDLHDCIARLNPGFSRTARFAASAASLALSDSF